MVVGLNGPDPAEVEARLQNLCGYHLSEPDPLNRYAVLTREQELYEGLVAAIRRERGRALAEVTRAGKTLGDLAAVTTLGSGQRVHRLISLYEQSAARCLGAPADASVLDRPDLVEVTSVTDVLNDDRSQAVEEIAADAAESDIHQSAWFDQESRWRPITASFE